MIKKRKGVMRVALVIAPRLLGKFVEVIGSTIVVGKPEYTNFVPTLVIERTLEAAKQAVKHFLTDVTLSCSISPKTLFVGKHHQVAIELNVVFYCGLHLTNEVSTLLGVEVGCVVYYRLARAQCFAGSLLHNAEHLGRVTLNVLVTVKLVANSVRAYVHCARCFGVMFCVSGLATCGQTNIHS